MYGKIYDAFLVISIGQNFFVCGMEKTTNTYRLLSERNTYGELPLEAIKRLKEARQGLSENAPVKYSPGVEELFSKWYNAFEFYSGSQNEKTKENQTSETTQGTL